MENEPLRAESDREILTNLINSALLESAGGRNRAEIAENLLAYIDAYIQTSIDRTKPEQL